MAKQAVKMVSQEFDPAVPLDKLTPHPMNPNQGDVGLLCELFDANGFAGAVLAQKSTGIIIDGEHRLVAARERGLKTIPVLWQDVDDETRDRLLAEWNESTRRGVNDDQKLLDLLTGLAGTPMGLTGSAFDGDDMDRLRARLKAPLIISDAPTGATYSETEDEMDERRARNEGYRDRKDGGNLIEMILVFSTDEREEVGKLLDTARSLTGSADTRASDAVLQALRVYVAVLEGRDGDAKDIAGAD